MLKRLILLVGFVAGALLPLSSAQAERRVALVIGNADYVHAKPLRNPKNDAIDMAEQLKKLGFEVVLGLDLDQSNFARVIDQYARALDGADVGLLFYAGHGLQKDEKNYLVSTSAQLSNPYFVTSETIELDAVVRLMESKTPVNIVFLDACRNNPLADRLRQEAALTRSSVSLGRGLARVEPTGRDTLIAFAAAPGQEADDGRDRNSPFTRALLRHIPKPGLEVSVMLKEVTADVRRETQNTQRPQQLSDMSRTFYFAQAEPAVAKRIEPAPQPQPQPQPIASAPPTAEDRTVELAFWNAAQAAKECEAVRAYLERFPSGAFVELARVQERRLCTSGRRVEVLEALPEPQRPSGNTAVAAVAEPAPVARPEPSKAVGEISRTELARAAQQELVRLGCGAFEADGRWNAASRNAVKLFNKHAENSLGDEPSQAMVTALREYDDRVCPEREPAPRKAEKTRERTKERKAGRAERVRRAERTPEPRRARVRVEDVEIRRMRPRQAAPIAAARPVAPAQSAPAGCFFDEGYGRKRPCDAGSR
ncbi:MAG TPA: caspase domain-containing protein [Xanthobacteraceae bacterium]